eukprot:10016771-Alexandrium_andersonii.AAC.1
MGRMCVLVGASTLDRAHLYLLVFSSTTLRSHPRVKAFAVPEEPVASGRGVAPTPYVPSANAEHSDC